VLAALTPDRGAGGDADADLAEAAVEDVGPVAGDPIQACTIRRGVA
jgi:hypothetical protein